MEPILIVIFIFCAIFIPLNLWALYVDGKRWKKHKRDSRFPSFEEWKKLQPIPRDEIEKDLDKVLKQ